MMKSFLSIVCLGFLTVQAWSAPEPEKFPEVDSQWPGVKMQVIEVDHIAGNRVIMIVRILATKSAPSSTLIGTPTQIPPGTREEDRGNFQPGAYTLDGATLTDELTSQTFPSVAPDPNGPTYRTSTTLESISPGGSCILAVQFHTPPPPPADPSGKVPKQTVSLLLPKAKGPITKIVIPPPNAAADKGTAK